MRLLGLCICCFIVVQAVAGSIIRGVAPYDLHFYKEDPFKCRTEPTRILPRSSLNDNYCDCFDGTDEPGTSACANGRYYCMNKGYKGTSVFSSQVNDGICDCCDGSDEFEGKVKCINNCAEKGAELKKQREAEKEKIKKGLQIKEQWMADAAKTLEEKRGSIDGLKAEVEKLKKVVEDLEAEKRGFEEKERAEQDVINERKKELERIEQERLQKEAPPPPENEQQEEAALKEMLENKEAAPEASPPGGEANHDDEDDDDEEPQKASTYDEPASHTPTPSPPDSSPPSPSPSPPSPPSHSPSPSRKPRSRPGRHPPREGVEPTPPPPTQPEEETELLKTIREGKRKIEDELSQVRRDLSTAENNLRSAEDILKMDFGPNNEYFGLHGNCYDYKTREYTYTICPYGDAKQGHTSLGKFEKWDPAYTAMSFTEGQQCWGGPKRSARVTMLCGAENELYDIQEPNKCEYAMKLNTPAACTSAPLELLELGGDEDPSAEGEHGSYFGH